MRSTSRAKPCRCTTAFGLPEVPDVWHQNAGVFSATRSGSTGEASAMCCRACVATRTRWFHGGGVSSAISATMMEKPASSRMCCHSAAATRGFTPTAMPPAQIVPRKATTQSMPSGSFTATRSPGRRPRARQAPAARATRSRSSPKVNCSLPQTSATRVESAAPNNTCAALTVGTASGAGSGSGAGASRTPWRSRHRRNCALRVWACSCSSAANSRYCRCSAEPARACAARDRKNPAARCSAAMAMRNRLPGSCGRLSTPANRAATSVRKAGDVAGRSVTWWRRASASMCWPSITAKR